MTSSDQPDDETLAHETDGTIRAEFDWSVVAPSTAVIEVVAIASNREPETMEPLYQSVDADALNELIRSVETGSAGREVVVSFGYADHDVTVHGTGVVAVRPAG